MISCPNCKKIHSVVHPEVNRCSCGSGFDGSGNEIDANIPNVVIKIYQPSAEQKKDEGYHNKPGSALESLIPDWVVQFKKGCGCKDYSKKMDRWGTDGCLAREKEIVGHLMGQSDKLIPIFRGIPKSLREAAAKKLLAKAIEISRKV
jgi:hypothetical protein